MERDTICVQGGYTAGKRRAPARSPLSSPLRLSMRPVRIWENCLIWRPRATSNPACRIPPATMCEEDL